MDSLHVFPQYRIVGKCLVAISASKSLLFHLELNKALDKFINNSGSLNNNHPLVSKSDYGIRTLMHACDWLLRFGSHFPFQCRLYRKLLGFLSSWCAY